MLTCGQAQRCEGGQEQRSHRRFSIFWSGEMSGFDARKDGTVQARYNAALRQWIYAPGGRTSSHRVLAPAHAEGMTGRSAVLLARCPSAAHACTMFSVGELTAEAIRQVFEESGEFSAVVELRRHFPAITDNAAARRCVRVIAGWKQGATPAPKNARPCGTRLSTS
jgi:hypothetical protein